MQALKLVLIFATIEIMTQAHVFAQPEPMFPLFTLQGLGSVVSDIDTDREGNVYVTGLGKPGGLCEPNLQSGNQGGGYVAKLDAVGNVIWYATIGNGNTKTTGIAVDGSGNVVVVGYYSGQAEMNPGTANFYLTAIGYEDMFVVKLKPDGKFAWAVSAGEDSDDRAYDVACDSTGNIFVTGFFKWIVDFNPGAGTNTLQSSLYGHNPFLWKLKPDGSYAGASKINTNLDAEGTRIALDKAGNPYITGYVVPTDRREFFVWSPSFFVKFRGSDNTHASGIAVDSKGNVIVSGWFGGTMDFDPGPDSTKLTAPAPWLADGFVLKLSPQGQYKWVYKIGSNNGYDTANALATDSLDRIYVVGRFRQTVDFDPGPGVFNLTSPSADGSDVFVQRVDSAGAFLWATRFGFPQFAEDEGWAAAVSKQGYVYAGSAIWGSGYTGTLSAFGACAVTQVTSEISGCDSMLLDGKVYTRSCQRNRLLPGSPCDTMQRMSIQIIASPMASISLMDSTLSAMPNPAATYQWYQCNGDLSLIPGAEGSAFTPTGSGYYAVVLTTGLLCSDTSECAWVDRGTSSSAQLALEQLEIWPNPTKGLLHINWPGNTILSVKIMDASGVVQDAEVLQTHQHQIDLKDLAPGVYLVYVSDGAESVVHRVVKTSP